MSTEPLSSTDRLAGTSSPTKLNGSFEIPNNNYSSDATNIYLSDPKAWDNGRNGPFNQTLFLGCSVTSFSTNLGWGGESSTCTVTLTKDTALHWNDPVFRSNTNILRNNNEQAKYPAWQNNRNRTFEPETSTSVAGTQVIVTGIVKEFLFPITNSNEPTRNISFKEVTNENKREQENTFLSQLTPSRPDYGKVYYKLNIVPGDDGTFYTKKFWTGPDPGFVGESYDILGCPVRFIFNEFEFCGIVTSWKNNGGQGGVDKYTVDIKSFSDLLNNTSLIIDHYYGSIYQQMVTKPPPFNGNPPLPYPFGMPSNDLGDRILIRGQEGETQSTDASTNQAKYHGRVSQGNTPNVFNIYGHLENALGFGISNTNEIGTKMVDIWNGLTDLINDGQPAVTGEDGWWDKAGRPSPNIDKRFSPYGRIIGKTPAIIKGSVISTNNTSPTISFLADTYRAVDIQTEQYYTLVQTKDSDVIINGSSVSHYVQSLSGVTNNSINMMMNDIGLLPNFIDPQTSLFRAAYRLDLSAVPVPPKLERIKGPVISVMDFVETVCSNAGYRLFVDFVPPDVITIKTISEHNQPPSNFMQRQISSAAAQGGVLGSYDYGKEFNDKAAIRAMYIGGKQKRLLQLNSNFLANKNNGLVYDPFDDAGNGKLMDHSLANILNIAKIPDHRYVRNPKFPYYTTQLFASLGGTGAMIWEDQIVDHFAGGQNCGLGNYLHPLRYLGVNIAASEYQGYGVGKHLGNPNANNDTIKDIFKPLGNSYFNASPNMYNINKDALEAETFTMKPIAVVRAAAAQIAAQPASVYYNYPLWDDFICPYFGLGIDGNARKVYYDTAMRQIQVICHIGDLSNLLGIALTRTLNIDQIQTKISLGKQETIPNPFSDLIPIGKEQSVSRNPPNKKREANDPPGAVGANYVGWGITSPDTLTQTWSIEEKDRTYHDPESTFLITENEIRAAIAGFDSWMEYSFNKNFTTDLSQIIRKTIFSNTGSVTTEITNDNALINTGLDSPITLVTRGPDVFFLENPSSENPSISPQAALVQKTKEMLETIHTYVAGFSEYYGKQFMVKIPGLNITRDATTISLNPALSMSYQTMNNAVLGEHLGAGKNYANYMPSEDGAWEEAGNFIDDKLLVGSQDASFFQEADGKFGAILGYNANYEYLKSTFSNISGIAPDGAFPSLLLQTMSFSNPDNLPTNYNSITGQYLPQTTAGLSAGNLAANFGVSIESIAGQKLLADSEAANRTMASHFTTLAKMLQPAEDIAIIPNEWYPSLNSSLDNSEFLYVSYPSYNEAFKANDSFSAAEGRTFFNTTHGKNVPSDLRFKMYVKARVEPNYIFIKSCIGPTQTYRRDFLEPRAIVTIQHPVNMNPVHKVDRYLNACLTLDTMLWQKEGCSIPLEISSDKQLTPLYFGKATAIHSGTLNDGLLPYSGGFGTHSPVISLSTDYIFEEVHFAQNSQEDENANLPIAPKAAMPGFAAIPLESRGSVYGPWTNHPWLIRKEIFTSKDLATDEPSLLASVENLVGGLKVTVDDHLCPWNYGGMAALDENVIAQIQGDAVYQLEIEQGTFELPGPPVYRIGELLNKLSKEGGPVINSLRTSIDSAGFSTSYSFRTFSKKFGLYNKESADRLAKINRERIERNKVLAERSANITNRSASSLKKQNINGAPTAKYVNPPIAATWRSASNILVGHSEFSLRFPQRNKSSTELAPAIKKTIQRTNYDLGWSSHPSFLGNPASGLYSNVVYPKFISHTKVMDSREIPSLLSSDYEESSYMSLDGILSPISFYPTSNSRTFHITKYPRTLCKFCLGSGKIKYTTALDPDAVTNKLLTNQGMQDLSLNAQQQNNKEVKIPCPYCCLDIEKKERLLSSSSQSKATPPFLVTQIGDKKLSDKAGTSTGLKTTLSASPRINYSTLNPAILAFGEFSAFQNRQVKDYTCHSIKMIGQGSIPPGNGAESLNQQGCNTDRLFKSCLEYDQIYLDSIHTLHVAGQSKPGTPNEQIKNQTTPFVKRFANNNRFFGLRGPLMLHSWGYDTDGYPVPNSSGELKFETAVDADGKDIIVNGIPKYVEDTNGNLQPVLGTRTVDGETVTYNIYKNQKWHPIVEGEDSSSIPPSEIVTYNGVQGYWTPAYKEITFARGWAQMQSTWPVGPIDLRWDETAGVWTTASQYKNTYVLLEEDLSGFNPARGEIVDNNQNIGGTMLPLGFRKTVFVKDNIGIYSAPRTAVVYCAYNSDNGFYEPITQSIANTSGLIISSNTAEFYNIYTTRNNTLASNTTNPTTVAAIKNTYVGKFTNPLDVDASAGNFAFFTYMNNSWILQSSRGS